VANKRQESLQDLGRFSEPALLVLISLADGPKHGYAMAQDIQQISGQKLGPGTLYGAITRLEAAKWIEPLPPADRRRPYKLTSSGAAVLRARLATLRSMTRAAQARLADA
jgi:DNA-binding PadR family transcriptional regulator